MDYLNNNWFYSYVSKRCNINGKQCIHWARSCENMSYANNNGADQLAHPRSLIITFVVIRGLDSMMVKIAENTFLWDVADPGLGLHCLFMPSKHKKGI